MGASLIAFTKEGYSYFVPYFTVGAVIRALICN